MGLRIATNVQSLNSQRQLDKSVMESNSSMEKLSSGYRINKASDDAAGLAISERLKADIKGLTVAKRNASDGISLIQTAEGGLNEITNILSRLRELGVQSSSDTITDNERGFLNKEYSSLKNEVERISKTTEFNGTLLLSGKRDDLPEELTANGNKYPIELQVGKNFLPSADGPDSQNPVNIIRINLEDLDGSLKGLGLGEVNDENGTHVSNKTSAQSSLSTLDKAINTISGYRATLGSIQSRLNSTVNNLSIASENASATNGAIRDTDFAVETAKLTQTNILKQSGVSVLSQANQWSQVALRLLG
jgi:flagellin